MDVRNLLRKEAFYLADASQERGTQFLNRASELARTIGGVSDAYEQVALAKMIFGQAIGILALFQKCKLCPRLTVRRKSRIEDLLLAAHTLETYIFLYLKEKETSNGRA